MAIGVWSGISGHRRGDRPARRRRGRAGHLLALDLLDQRPDRARRAAAGAALAEGEPRPLRDARPARAGARLDAARSGSCSGSCARSRWAGRAPTVLASHDRRRRAAGRLRRAGSCAPREPMLPMSFFAKRSFAVTNVASLSMYFGMFGSIFFLVPVHAERARQHAAAGRAEAARVDGRHDGRGAAGGGLLRALRQPPVHVRGPVAAGGRAGVACEHDLDAPALLADDRPVHHGRRRYGARVRSLRQRGARPPCAPSRPARPPAPTTRSARSAVCSGWRCSRRCSPAPADMLRRRRSSTA